MTDFNVFVNQNQTIEPDIATKIAEKHGFVLEKERREKGGGVHKVEQVVVAPPPPVIEKEEELKPRAPDHHFHGSRRSRQDFAHGCDPQDARRGGRSRRNYAAHRRLHASITKDSRSHFSIRRATPRLPRCARAARTSPTSSCWWSRRTTASCRKRSRRSTTPRPRPHVKIMVAINKIDLPGANIDRVKKQLQERELAPEDWGGDTIVVPVSATKGTGIDQLLEMMTLQAEVMELKASPTATPRGTVIEAQVEAGPRPDCHGDCANGHAQSGRSIHLRRLRRQSEVAHGRSRQADERSRAVDAGESSRIYRSAECGRRISRDGIGARGKDVERRTLGSETRGQTEHAATRDARKPCSKPPTARNICALF